MKIRMKMGEPLKGNATFPSFLFHTKIMENIKGILSMRSTSIASTL